MYYVFFIFLIPEHNNMVLQQKTLHWQYQTPLECPRLSIKLEERGGYTNPYEKMQEIKREKKKRIQKDTATSR
jgi:hypothetical protein